MTPERCESSTLGIWNESRSSCFRCFSTSSAKATARSGSSACEFSRPRPSAQMIRVPLSSTSILFTAASHRATLFCTVRITAVPWRVAAATSPSGPAARSRLWQLMKRTETSRISAMFVSRPASSFGHTALGMYHPMSSFSSRFITSRAGGRGTESASTSRLSMIIKSPSGLLPSSFDAGWPSASPCRCLHASFDAHVSPEAANGSATASCAMGGPASTNSH